MLLPRYSELPAAQNDLSAYRMVKLEEPSCLVTTRSQTHSRLVSDMRKQRPDLKPDYLLVDGNGLLHPADAVRVPPRVYWIWLQSA